MLFHGVRRSNQSLRSQALNLNMLLSLKLRKISSGWVSSYPKLVLFPLLLLNFPSILPVIIKALLPSPKTPHFMHVLNTFHSRTKHIDVHFHFIRQCIIQEHISLFYVPTSNMIADIFTKSLPYHTFIRFCSSLGLS